MARAIVYMGKSRAIKKGVSIPADFFYLVIDGNLVRTNYILEGEDLEKYQNKAIELGEFISQKMIRDVEVRNGLMCTPSLRNPRDQDTSEYCPFGGLVNVSCIPEDEKSAFKKGLMEGLFRA